MIFITNLFKKILTFLIILLFLTAFSGSYNALSIDRLAYVVAIAIDSSTNNNYTISFQFTNMTSPTESGTSEKSPSIVNSVEASSIGSAINLMNTYIDKRLNLSHCKVIVFSEEIASKGISDLIYTLMNDNQIRPSAYIVISKCNAKYYIENSKPQLDNLITKYYDIFPTSSNYTSYTTDSTIGEFFNKLKSETSEPTAILGGMNSEEPDKTPIPNENKDSNNIANESTISGQRGSENIGVAVFKGDKMIGELNALECLSYLNITNKSKGFFISIPNPEDSNSNIDLYLSPTNTNQTNVEIINGTPYIHVKATYSARITSLNSDSKYLNSNVLDSISKSCNSYLESTFSDYLYKTSREFKSDINGFGNNVLNKFWTTQEFNDYDWKSNYKDSYFDVKVNTSVESSVLLTET